MMLCKILSWKFYRVTNKHSFMKFNFEYEKENPKLKQLDNAYFLYISMVFLLKISWLKQISIF